MRNFETQNGKLVELTPEALQKRIAENRDYFSNSRLPSGEEIKLYWDDAQCAKRLEEETKPAPEAPVVDRLAEIVKNIPDEVFADPAMVAFLGGAKLLADSKRFTALELAISNLPSELDTFKNAALQEVAKEK